MLLQVFLNPALQYHIKANFSSVLSRIMRMSLNYDTAQGKPMHSNYLNTLIIPVVQGFQSNEKEIVIGAITVCESVYRVITIENVDTCFLSLSQALC